MNSILIRRHGAPGLAATVNLRAFFILHILVCKREDTLVSFRGDTGCFEWEGATFSRSSFTIAHWSSDLSFKWASPPLRAVPPGVVFTIGLVLGGTPEAVVVLGAHTE